jgi:hypothetical protein
MTTSLSFDISGAHTDDRARICINFKRHGWDAIGESTWIYRGNDVFNEMLPALNYFKTLTAARGMDVTKYQIDANISSSYSANAGIGSPIRSAEAMKYRDFEGGQATKLSERRLRKFARAGEQSLVKSLSNATDDAAYG